MLRELIENEAKEKGIFQKELVKEHQTVEKFFEVNDLSLTNLYKLLRERKKAGENLV